LKLFQYSVLILFSLTLILHAEWKPFKSLEAYEGSAYRLKENIAYMEIRLYPSQESQQANKILKLYAKPLSTYPKKIREAFQKITHRQTQKASYLHIRNNGNLFFIDKKEKFFWTDERKDLKMLLGKIDTPAELLLLLWLDYNDHWQGYKKSAKGYWLQRISKISACMKEEVIGRVDKEGNYESEKDVRHIVRIACGKRKYTTYISHQTISYVSYHTFDIDSNENLYILGYVKENKSNESKYFTILDKYNTHGKHLWSKKVAGFGEVKVKNHFVYVSENSNIKAKYTLKGERVSFQKKEQLTFVKRGQKKRPPVIPMLLANEKRYIQIIINDWQQTPKGNYYMVGSEVLYPLGTPHGFEMCGNNGEVEGAVIAKFNRKREMLWAKVLDRDD